jgi:hypothetical protein
MSGGRNGSAVKLAAGVAMAVALSGCVQATRHSNAIVFGTNTSLGVTVGPNAASVPSISVGYNRQEAVLMPLVANVGEVTTMRTRSVGTGPRAGNTTSTENLLTPCDPGNDVQVLASQPGVTGSYPIHPCLLVATNRQATDAYSVLASFGAQFSGSAKSTDATARLGIAQYFSTGMAAQLLATTGGASVANLTAPPPGPSAVAATAALFGSDVDRSRAVALVTGYDNFRRNLVKSIGGAVDDATMLQRIQAFEKLLSPSYRLSTRCMTKLECLTLLSDSATSPYDSDYAANNSGFDGGMATWLSNPN